MTGLSNATLWQRIQDYQFDKSGADLTFTQRLARENGWDLDFARRAVYEYKRFIYLICVSDGVLTPSEDVDHVWHLHMVYTRDYWERFCRDTLGRDLHHDPTEGGSSEDAKFLNAYRRTLSRYSEEFATAPQNDIWPDARDRFAVTPRQIVNPDETIVLHKSNLELAAVMAGAGAIFLLGGLIGFNHDGEAGVLIMIAAVVGLLGYFYSKTQPRNRDKKSGGAGGCGSGAAGCGSSGCGGGGCGGS